ncbi:MAG: hypothetical protein DRN66_02225 [Candidatus Nanohalarchaeota archaeon]|nr:MAG: hypothetical protein DRN66_02225 [Candidatus Nanohaloarchaeota archaeon]
MISSNVLIKGYHYSEKIYSENYITYLCCDLTKACNYRCIYCGNATHKDKGKDLTTNQREKLISNLKEYGLKTVIFAGEGEPTIDPDFYHLIKHNYAIGLTTIVYSNIAVLNKRKIEFLYSHDVSLVIKIDSLDEEIYNKMTGSNEYVTFKENLENLLLVYGREPHEEKRIEIATVLTELNKREPKKIKKLCDEHGLVYCCKTAGKKGMAGKKWEKICPNGTIELEKIAKKYTDKYQTTGTILGDCAVAGHGIAVLKSGECVLCPSLTDYVYANVKTNTVEEIISIKRKIYDWTNKPACIAKYIQNTGGTIESLVEKHKQKP